MTQTDLATLVAKRAGASFSQQAMAKLESNPEAQSRFMHHLLAVLEECEAGERLEARKLLDRVPEHRLHAAKAFLEMLTQEQGD